MFIFNYTIFKNYLRCCKDDLFLNVEILLSRFDQTNTISCIVQRFLHMRMPNNIHLLYMEIFHCIAFVLIKLTSIFSRAPKIGQMNSNRPRMGRDRSNRLL